MKRVWFSFLFIIVFFTNSWASLPIYHIIRPYFFQPEEVVLGLNNYFFKQPIGLLNVVEISLDYGVNENLAVGFSVPYMFFFNAESPGLVGDANIYVKFLIAQSDTLFWKLSGELFYRLPTGVRYENASVRSGTSMISYYPVSTGTSMLCPTLIGSLFLDQWMFGLAVSYKNENAADSDIVQFDYRYDRFGFQLMADYYFKFTFFGDEMVSLIYRPALAIDYQLNISPNRVFKDIIQLTFENNFRLGKSYRWKISFSLPIYNEEQLYQWMIGAQFMITL